jgi:hypothetical protein
MECFEPFLNVMVLRPFGHSGVRVMHNHRLLDDFPETAVSTLANAVSVLPIAIVSSLVAQL